MIFANSQELFLIKELGVEMERAHTVLSVISLLIVVAVWAPKIDPTISDREGAQADARMLDVALRLYQRKHGELPVIPTDRNSAPIYASGSHQNVWIIDLSPEKVSPSGEFLDPWKHPFTFRLACDRIVVSSPGPDGRPETADDISSEN